MSTIRLTEHALEVRLNRLEQIGALHGNIRVPRAEIRAADVVPDGLAAAKGVRAPGFAVPGRLKLGTWRGRGGRQFVAVRRGQPALRLTLGATGREILLVSAPHAADIAADLAADLAADRRGA